MDRASSSEDGALSARIQHAPRHQHQGHSRKNKRKEAPVKLGPLRSRNPARGRILIHCKSERQSEVIVHAGTNDVAVEVRFCRRIDHATTTPQEAYQRRSREIGACQASGRIGRGAQIIIEIFELGAPVRGEHPLTTRTDSVSHARAGKCSRCRSHREGRSACVDPGLSDCRVGFCPAVSQTTGYIQK